MRCPLSLLNPSQHASENLALATSSHNSTAEENRVIRQLLEALLFERLCEFTYQAGNFCFVLGHSQYQVTGYISGFSRVRIDANKMFYRHNENLPRVVSQNTHWKPITLDKIINDLPASQTVKQQLTTELEQTIKLCRWNKQHLVRQTSRRQLTYSQLESAIDEGHPYHPCFKARTGFSEQDHQLYGPEYANQFQLHWLAVRRCYLKRRFSSVSEKTFWRTELGEACYQSLTQKLAKKTADSAAFSLLPIHPWQWKNLQSKLTSAIAQQQVFYLGEAGDKYQASISVRTLLNMNNPQKANIKLPLNIINTSSLRTIESHTICTAPIISDWLVQLHKSDKYLQKNMILLAEYAGIRPTNDGAKVQPWIDELDGQLGVIFRQSLNRYCDEKTVVPFVALTIIEHDDKPFIEPWVNQYGCEKWLQKLVDTVVLPIWHLLVHHGIAIEAHGQNILLQHKEGWPEKVIVRDFHESLEYVDDYLAQPDLTPIFDELEEEYHSGKPNQYYWMTDIEALRELLVDTLFVFNLTDLAVLLEKHYHYSEQSFWQLIFKSFKDYHDSGITSSERIAKIDLFQPDIKTESLLDKKFRGSRETEFHHQIKNPLATAANHYFSQEKTVLKNQTQKSAKASTVLGKTPCLQ